MEKTITEAKATNEPMTKENAQLAKYKRLLVEYNAVLKESVSKIVKGYKGFESSKEKLSREILALEASKMSVSYNSDYAYGFPDSFT